MKTETEMGGMEQHLQAKECQELQAAIKGRREEQIPSQTLQREPALPTP